MLLATIGVLQWCLLCLNFYEIQVYSSNTTLRQGSQIGSQINTSLFLFFTRCQWLSPEEMTNDISLHIPRFQPKSKDLEEYTFNRAVIRRTLDYPGNEIQMAKIKLADAKTQTPSLKLWETKWPCCISHHTAVNCGWWSNGHGNSELSRCL